jgi:ABC-2 type transport system ATP-binding protein
MSDELVIETEGLTRYFGRQAAVDSLDLWVPKGAVVGLLGRNGAGKTTTIKMLMGLLRPSRGRSAVLGCDSTEFTPDVLGRIGYLPEGHPTFGWMTLDGAARFFRAASPRWRQEILDRAVDYFGLPREAKLRSLSRGQRAQAALVLTAARDPDLLVLDDPTQGVDPVARRELLAALVELIHRQDRTVLLSSHLLGDVERICDRVVVIDRGVMRADCPVDTFKEAIRRVEVPQGEDWAELPGMLWVEERPESCVLTFVDTDGSTLLRVRERAGDEVAEAELNLEEAFIAFTSDRRKRTLDWGGGQ